MSGYGVGRVVNSLVLILLGIASPYFVGGQTRSGASVDIEALFTPSGWMGDGEYGRKYIDFSAADRSSPHSAPTSIKVTYSFGPMRWAGIYWQNEPDNWGDKPGANYAGKGFARIAFWAKGEIGGEVVEFKAGGIDNRAKKYRDSFTVTLGRITLAKEWREYRINLVKQNLSSVIGAFCWIASADYNADKRITFYVDDVSLE